MRRPTYVALAKLSVFAVITIMLTFVLAVTIANGSVGNTANYRATFSDATGLLPGDDVRIAGVRVGQVKKVALQNGRDAGVNFTLLRSIPLRTSAQATIKYRNLVGQRYVDIVETPGADQVVPAGAEMPLRGISAVDLTVLFDGFKPLFKALDPEQVNTLSLEIVRTLQGEGSAVNGLLASTASLTTTLANRDATIGSVIDNLTQVLSVVDQRNSGLDQLVVQLQRLVSGLAGDRSTLSAALTNVDSLATSTTRLLGAVRPSLPTDLTALAAVTQTLATTTNPDGQNTLDEFLRRFPTKLNSIIRTATYGSWFNFYLCDADLATTGVGPPVPIHLHSTNVTVCGSG